ncbi:MAG: efflux RND transporter periplasmic adaptor subunit, partial [bacterium]
VYVVDADGRLRFRDVEVLRHRRDEVVVRSGLRSGDRAAITLLRGAVDGMLVRIAENDDAVARAAQ